jgi:hypothetical protein
MKYAGVYDTSYSLQGHYTEAILYNIFDKIIN